MRDEAPLHGAGAEDLRIIADDLTGALDSACAFASIEQPIPVGFSWSMVATSRRGAISTGSRDVSEDVSRRVTEEAFHRLSGWRPDGAFWFKKVDSVLRGHPLSETLAVFRAGRFDHLVFAPAFPELGRITVGGQQMVQESDYQEPRSVGPPLAAAFEAQGLTAQVLRSGRGVFTGETRAAGSVWILDATTQQELREAAMQIGERLPGRILWCGSGGLALARAGGRPPIQPPPIMAVITGTRHPATLRQIETLAAELETYSGARIHAPSLTSTSPEHTAMLLDELGRSLVVPNAGEHAIAVIGGDSLATLLKAMQARDLLCVGETERGVPVSRVRGGRLDGLTLVTKSGGFGGDRLLTRLVRRDLCV